MNIVSTSGSLITSEGCWAVLNLKARLAEAAVAPETVPTAWRHTSGMDCRFGKMTLHAKLPAPMQPTLTSSPLGDFSLATVACLLFDAADPPLYSRIAVYSPLRRSA